MLTTLAVTAIPILQRINILSTSVGFLILIFMCLFVVLKSIQANKFNINKNIIIYYFILQSPILIMILNITNPINNIDALKPFLSQILFMLLIASINKIDMISIAKLSTIFIFSFLLIDFYNMYQNNSGYIKKIYTLSNPNYFGIFLNLYLFVLIKFKNNIKQSSVFVSLNVIATLLTLSKSAIIVSVIIISLNYLSLINYRSIFNMALMVFLLFLFSIAFNESNFIYFFVRTFDQAVSTRLDLLDASIDCFSMNIISGVGYSNFGTCVSKINSNYSGYETHNLILTILSEGGILSTFLFFLSMVLVLFHTIINKKMYLPFFIYLSYSMSHGSGETLIILPLIIYLMVSKNDENKKMDKKIYCN